MAVKRVPKGAVGGAGTGELDVPDVAVTKARLVRWSARCRSPTPIRGGRQNSSQGSSQGAAEQDTPNGQPEKPASSKRGGAGKARKSQVDLLKTLAVEWRGENGVERLENRLGKPLKDMTRAEADEWIDRLTPEGRE